MPDDLYERYKEALRTGHVAVLRGSLNEAVESYRIAAGIAPSRALPHTSLGGVFLRLGNLEEALTEFTAAVARAPHDEGALLGQAEALAAAGIRTEAAAALDHVAEIQEAGGRTPEAADTLRRAIELDESADRIRRQRELQREIRFGAGDHAAEQLLARALRLRDDVPPEAPQAEIEFPRVGSPAVPAPEPAVEPRVEGVRAAADAETVGEPSRVEARGVPAVVPAVAEAVEPAPGARVEARPTVVAYEAQPEPVVAGEALPEPKPERAGEPQPVPVMAEVDATPITAAGTPAAMGESAHQPTGDELLAAAESADNAGDTAALRSLLVWTARAYAREGRFEAALDATDRLLLRYPGDVDAHLVLVELYVARSWDSLATEKLKLLDRLAELNGDDETHQRVCAAASRAFPNEPSLQNICA